MRLKDKVALVTGAGSGIGRAIAELFAAEGARVLASDVSPEKLAALATTPGLQTLAGDVSKDADCAAMVKAAQDRYGGLDVLVNNAGVMDRFLPVGELDDALWQRVIGVNLTGPMQLSRAAIGPMTARGGGVIVNIASVGGLAGTRGGAAYVASKHGLLGLTKNIAATYLDAGIRCVAICPGGVDTGIPIGGQPSARGYAAIQKVIPSNPRSAQAAEIARLALYLASEDASFVNGTAVVADGGWLAF
jgi:NAD(P)-dependent dehydrogenase (short-subunit alcohol dehydrogenase family)